MGHRKFCRVFRYLGSFFPEPEVRPLRRIGCHRWRFPQSQGDNHCRGKGPFFAHLTRSPYTAFVFLATMKSHTFDLRILCMLPRYSGLNVMKDLPANQHVRFVQQRIDTFRHGRTLLLSESGIRTISHYVASVCVGAGAKPGRACY